MEPIYEIGSYRVKGQEKFADLRSFFPGKKYIGCDIRPGLGVDRVEDVENLSLPDESVGTFLVIDTFEHVQDVYKAINEIYRVLKPGGMVILASVMKWPIHDYPSDYWRFTPSAFELLLGRFEKKEVEFDGDPEFPTGLYGYGIKSKKIKQGKKSKYAGQVVDLENKNSVHTKIINLVGNEKNVLDFGCSSGYLGEILKTKFGCHLVGVEINEVDAQKARQKYHEVITSDIENFKWEEKLEESKFDVAIFADVLEHLKNPQLVLKKTKKFLKKGGRLLVSLPNSAHLSVRLELLLGQLKYQEIGLLDNTHLHFYTFASAIDLLENSGYFVTKVDASYKDLPDKVVQDFLKRAGLVYTSKLKKLFSQPEALVYQHVFQANVKRPENYRAPLVQWQNKPAFFIEKIIKQKEDRINQLSTFLFQAKTDNKFLKNFYVKVSASKAFKLWQFYCLLKKKIKSVLK